MFSKVTSGCIVFFLLVAQCSAAPQSEPQSDIAEDADENVLQGQGGETVVVSQEKLPRLYEGGRQIVTVPGPKADGVKPPAQAVLKPASNPDGSAIFKKEDEDEPEVESQQANESAKPSDTELRIWTITAIVVGVLLVVLLIGVIVFCVMRRRAKAKESINVVTVQPPA